MESIWSIYIFLFQFYLCGTQIIRRRFTSHWRRNGEMEQNMKQERKQFHAYCSQIQIENRKWKKKKNKKLNPKSGVDKKMSLL